MRRRLLSIAAAAALAVGGVAGITSKAEALTNINLGFILDGSGSVGSSQFNQARTALANAINANVPTSQAGFTYTIGVSVFGATGVKAFNAITVNDAASLASVVAAVNGITYGAGYSTGATCFNCGFNALNDSFGGGIGGETGIVNMSTDGRNNTGGSANKNLLKNAGWDSLSFEGIGGGVNTTALAALGFDTTDNAATIIPNAAAITDPLNDAFVLNINDFGAQYAAALNNKIRASVIPLPAGLPLLLGGLFVLGGLGAARRRFAAAA